MSAVEGGVEHEPELAEVDPLKGRPDLLGQQCELVVYDQGPSGPADAKIIPGHGPLTDIAGLKTFQRMLLETSKVVRKGVAAGKTLEQLQAAGLPDEWKSWSSFIDTKGWIAVLYDSLKGAKKNPAGSKHH